MTRTAFGVDAQSLRTLALFSCLFAFYFLFSFFYSPSPAHAALLYFDPSEASVARGDTVTVALRLDTDEGECVNTVDAVIHYDSSIRAVDVSRGKSILSLWVEDPTIDESAQTIRFAGGIQGGYCGRIPGDPGLTNVVLEVVFRSPGFNIGGGAGSPDVRIWLDDSSQVFLHDGLGTPGNLRLQDALLTLLPVAGNTPSDEWRGEVQADKVPPADFSIELAEDEVAFNGKYFIVFNTQDKQSGIDHYEVMEEPLSEFGTFTWGGADAPWVEASSPYVLTDQTLNSTIRVKAIDKAGNVRIATLVPDEAMRSISRDRLLTILVVGSFVLLLGGLAVFALWKRRQRILAESETTPGV